MTITISKEYFPEIIHTGLRKGMDSALSAVIWNSIYLIPEWVWVNFCNQLFDEFQDKEITARNILIFTQDYDHTSNMETVNWFMGESTGTKRAISIFKCAINAMVENDTDDLANWILYCQSNT